MKMLVGIYHLPGSMEKVHFSWHLPISTHSFFADSIRSAQEGGEIKNTFLSSWLPSIQCSELRMPGPGRPACPICPAIELTSSAALAYFTTHISARMLTQLGLSKLLVLISSAILCHKLEILVLRLYVFEC